MLGLHRIAEKVNCHISGLIGPKGFPCYPLNSSVDNTFESLYFTPTFAATYVRAGLKEHYLIMFLHPALYHLLQVLGTHHSEVEPHLGLLDSLNETIYHLKRKESAFSGEPRLVIVNLQNAVHSIHHRLDLIESGFKIFIHLHVSSTVEAF